MHPGPGHFRTFRDFAIYTHVADERWRSRTVVDRSSFGLYKNKRRLVFSIALRYIIVSNNYRQSLTDNQESRGQQSQVNVTKDISTCGSYAAFRTDEAAGGGGVGSTTLPMGMAVSERTTVTEYPPKP